MTLKPCFNGGITAVLVYKQESKIEIPKNGNKLIFGKYAASKLEAEKQVLKSNGTLLKNGINEFFN